MTFARIRSGLRPWVVVLLASAWLGVALVAQEPQSEFVPLDSLEDAEVLPATPLVFIAYALVWLILLVYVFALWRRLGRVEKELDDVRARLAAKRG